MCLYSSPQWLQCKSGIGDVAVPLSIKNKPKMLRDVGMAVPKTTETRYGGGSIQARQGV